MKKYILLLLASILILQCTPNVSQNTKINEAFYEDLKTENRRVRGTLYLDIFDQNLDTLTYSFYIQYIKGSPQQSAKGLAELIESADEHDFQTRPNSFLIALLYKSERKIIVDDAYTAKLDTVLAIKEGESFPNLKEFAQSFWNKNKSNKK